MVYHRAKAKQLSLESNFSETHISRSGTKYTIYLNIVIKLLNELYLTTPSKLNLPASNPPTKVLLLNILDWDFWSARHVGVWSLAENIVPKMGEGVRFRMLYNMMCVSFSVSHLLKTYSPVIGNYQGSRQVKSALKTLHKPHKPLSLSL